MEATRPVTAAAPFVPAAAHDSAVSWGAVLAGSAAACALSLILVFLGLGFGMSQISPWTGSGASATALSVGAVAWILSTQVIAAAAGGYLAGRLRVRWPDTPRDEVYFRDTTHGLLAWAVATLVVAACFTSTLAMVARTGAEIGGDVVAGVATSAAAKRAADDGDGSGVDYAVDVLLRGPAPVDATTPDANGPTGTDPTAGRDGAGGRGEIVRIYRRALQTGTLADADAKYLAQVTAQRGGIAPAEAEARVRQAYADLQSAANAAKETADMARKAAAHTSLWLFIALLAGAFFASLCATFGGRQRDDDPPRRP